MQRIQIARGEIATRQAALPLLAGEYFLDTTPGTGYQLYIGTGGDGNYEWKSIEQKDANNNIIGGPNGAYKKIGTTNPIGFFDTHAQHDVPGYKIKSIPANPTTGAMYIADQDIQVSMDDAVKFENLHSDGTDEGSTPEIKSGDIIIWSGYKWVKINNAGGTAKDSDFYNKVTQAPNAAGATNVQDAIVALDSQKLAYMGVLVDKDDYTKGDKLTLVTGDKFTFSVVKADGTTKTLDTGKDLGEVEGTVWLIEAECTIDGKDYEEGDFLTVTTTKKWSERAKISASNPNELKLEAKDVILTHVPGGTHDPAKIYITKNDLPRSEHGDHVYGNEEITNVKEALQAAFKTKADLDPNTGKLLISELPDTIIGAMEYQSTYNGGTTPAAADVVTLTDGSKAYAGFVLPTAADKTSVDNDADDVDPARGLVKGDYWIFSNTAYKWDITALVENGTIEGSGLAEVDGKKYITNGDWIIFNGNDANGKGKWSVIDNTDAFVGIKVDDKVVQSTVEIKGQNRLDTDIEETSVVIDGQVVTVRAQKAVLADEGVDKNVIYKSGSATNRTAVKSNLTDDGDKLTIVEDTGIDLKTKSGEDSAQVTATIVGNDTDATLKLPNIDTTIAANEDLGIVDAASAKKGTDWFATMYRTEDNRKVIRDSFLEFLGTDADGKRALSGFKFHDETSAGHTVEFRLSSDTGATVQVLPRLSGYLLNSNSIIDCGVWNSTHTKGFAPTEGYTSDETKIYKNRVTYGDIQSDETLDSDDLLTDSEKEEISAHITSD